MAVQLSDGKQNSSVCLLLDQLKAAAPDHSSYSFLSFLPELYGDAATDRCMIQATDAFVHAYFAKETDGAHSKNPKGIYCTALQATNLMLSAPGKAATDVAIATVWLLAIYEASFTSRRLLICNQLTEYIRC